MSTEPVPAFIGQVMPDRTVDALINSLPTDTRCARCGMRNEPITAKRLKRFPANLTECERRTVILLCMGLQNKEIASRMETTEQVIKNRLRFIFQKVGVTDRTQLLIRMMKFKYEGV